MQCCTSARKLRASKTADTAPALNTNATTVLPAAEPLTVEQISDRERFRDKETLQSVSLTSPSSNPSPSGRASMRIYDEEMESNVDIEAAYLVVSNSLAAVISSKERLLRALYISGRHPSKRQINLLWKDFADKNGNIDFKAFTQICQEEKLPTRADFLKAFEYLDQNNSGYIDIRDLETFLLTKGEKMTKEEFSKLISLLNISSDGKIRYGDFCETILLTAHDCREVVRRNRDVRLREPIIFPEPRHDSVHSSSTKQHLAAPVNQRTASTSKEREISEQQVMLQQQLSKRHPDCVFCKALDPAHAVRPKIPKLDSWNELVLKGYFILDDPSKGGFITPSYNLVVKRETRLFVNIGINKSQRLSERLQKLDLGFYIANETTEGKMGSIHLSEFGFGEVFAVCDLRPGKYLVLPYTTGCVLKDYDASSKGKTDPKQRPKSAGAGGPPKLMLSNGKLSKELVDCVEDVFRLFDLDGDGFLSKAEFSSYYRNSEDEVILDDTAWNAVLGRSGADGQKLAFNNFVKLFELELEDADEDGLEDIVIGLNNLGISRHLIMEEACGYTLHVFSEFSDAEAKLFVGNELSSMNGPIREAIVSETLEEGLELPCRRLADVGASAYAFSDDRHVKVVVRYKAPTKTRIQLRLDASESVACMLASGSGSLRGKDGNSASGPRTILTSTIPSNTTVPLLFALPTHPERMAEFVISSLDLLQP